jgi:hypothetical protein
MVLRAHEALPKHITSKADLPRVLMNEEAKG